MTVCKSHLRFYLMYNWTQYLVGVCAFQGPLQTVGSLGLSLCQRHVPATFTQAMKKMGGSSKTPRLAVFRQPSQAPDIQRGSSRRRSQQVEFKPNNQPEGGGSSTSMVQSWHVQKGVGRIAGFLLKRIQASNRLGKHSCSESFQVPTGELAQWCLRGSVMNLSVPL